MSAQAFRDELEAVTNVTRIRDRSNMFVEVDRIEVSPNNLVELMSRGMIKSQMKCHQQPFDETLGDNDAFTVEL